MVRSTAHSKLFQVARIRRTSQSLYGAFTDLCSHQRSNMSVGEVSLLNVM